MSIAGVFPAEVSLLFCPLAVSNARVILAGLIIFFTVLSIVLGSRLHVLQPQSIVGPDRLPPTGGLAGVALVMLVGLGAWIFAQGIYGQMVMAQWHKAGHADTPDILSIFTPHQLGVLQSVPPAFAFALMLIADRLVQRGLPATLGLAPSLLGPGIMLGMLWIVIIFPPILWTNLLAEQIYQAVRFAHPHEHPLLKSLGETSDSNSRVLLLLSATLIAPFFEELLFRGHLQTLIRQGILSLRWRLRLQRLGATVVPVVSVDSRQLIEPQPLIPYQAPSTPMPPLQGPFPAWPSWVAVILTSLLFVSVHPLWSFPPIFVLSLGLGYLYERTGNLWASITLHLLFNVINTAQFVFLMHQ